MKIEQAVGRTMHSIDSGILNTPSKDSIIDHTLVEQIKAALYENDISISDDLDGRDDSIYRSIMDRAICCTVEAAQQSPVSELQQIHLDGYMDNFEMRNDDAYTELFNGLEAQHGVPVDDYVLRQRDIDLEFSQLTMDDDAGLIGYDEYMNESTHLHTKEDAIKSAVSSAGDILTVDEAQHRRDINKTKNMIGGKYNRNDTYEYPLKDGAKPRESLLGDYKKMGLNDDMIGFLEGSSEIDKGTIDKSVSNFRQFDADAQARKRLESQDKTAVVNTTQEEDITNSNDGPDIG